MYRISQYSNDASVDGQDCDLLAARAGHDAVLKPLGEAQPVHRGTRRGGPDHGLRLAAREDPVAVGKDPNGVGTPNACLEPDSEVL